MRSHADDLNSGPLHRLATLIRDKQQVKKSYQSLHQQLESHNHKVCWEIQTCTVLSFHAHKVFTSVKSDDVIFKNKALNLHIEELKLNALIDPVVLLLPGNQE